jgi:hypothetical protein
MATRKKKENTEPTVVKGNHLTVTTFPDGKTVLEWDDEALLKEVREALASVELADMKPTVRAKAGKRINKVKETK